MRQTRTNLYNIFEKVDEIMALLDALTAQVATNTTVTQSAVTLINGIASQITAAGTDPKALAALVTSLNTSDTALAAAVTANTPVTTTPPVTSPWNSTTTYTQGQVVTFTDGNSYTSNAGGNTNNTPSATSTFWTVVPTTTTPPTTAPAWSATVSYAAAALVTGTDGNTYTSNAAGNIGNNPTPTSTFWTMVPASAAVKMLASAKR